MALLSTASNPGVIQRFTPRFELLPFVDLIWQYNGLVQAHALERVLPTGNMQMIINLAEDRTRKYDAGDLTRVERHPGSIISGPHSGVFVIDTQQASVLGVAFAPGGAAPFLGMPASEVRDLHVSLEDIWGTSAAGLRERLVEAEPHDRFGLLEHWLIQQAFGDLSRHPAVTYALTEFSGVPHTRTVSAVTDRVGLSSRRFIEVFNDEVGLTPKLYCRIQRFQHAIRLAHQNEDVDWADLAARVGYYDQSHLIREFQEFSGLSPSAYLKDRGIHLNHVPLSA
ncbi:MAG: AraC family transcriptional regulator [Chloroflexi bacterium]|nr:MAG: AraC family transcriptional regulator [Chloroflexota bacterium]